VIDGFGGKPEALVAIFSAVEERYGYLPERALRGASERMSIHWAQIFGAAGLGGFRLLPVDGHLLTVCTCAACRFGGGEALLAALQEDLGISPGETTADGTITLATSDEVAAGALSPALRIDTMVYGPLTLEQGRHVVAERRKAPSRGRAAQPVS
jgi:NADH:ubiquinone oxidoreductase subunit E